MPTAAWLCVCMYDRMSTDYTWILYYDLWFFEALRHDIFLGQLVFNHSTSKAHFILLLSGVQPVTILWITTAHVLPSLSSSVHWHLLPLWGGPQLSLCVHAELPTRELWHHPNQRRGRRREVWWREDMIVIEHFRVQSVSTSEEFSIMYCININQYQCWVPQVWVHVYTCIRILNCWVGSEAINYSILVCSMSHTYVYMNNLTTTHANSWLCVYM